MDRTINASGHVNKFLDGLMQRTNIILRGKWNLWVNEQLTSSSQCFKICLH